MLLPTRSLIDGLTHFIAVDVVGFGFDYFSASARAFENVPRANDSVGVHHGKNYFDTTVVGDW